ncbi:MAG: phosphotransferase family protein [Thermomicrobiales bacterium]
MTDSTKPNIDLAAASDFLDALYGDARTSAVAPIGAGAWSRAYSFFRADRAYVVRFAALREDFERDRIAAAFSSAALPVPRMVDIGEAFDGYYAITERAHGDFLDHADSAQMRRILPALLAALDAARGVDLSTSTGYGTVDIDGNGLSPSWQSHLCDIARDTIDQRTYGWRERLRTSHYGLDAFDRAYACLESLAPRCPNDRHVIHSDLINRNVLIEGDRINAVFDWGCLQYGDFLYDIAWLTFWAPWYPAWRGIDFEAESLRHARAIGLDLPDAATRLRCYEIHIGLAHFAYNAFLGSWSDYEQTVARTLAIVDTVLTAR